MASLCISCSGGGALGVGPAKFLSNLENDLGKKINTITAGYAGTSTGAILAACLNEGMSAGDILQLYKDNLDDIFKEYSCWQKIKKHPCPKYDNSALKKLLQEKLVGKCSDWKKPIFIPTFDMIRMSNPEKIFDIGDSDIDKWFAVLASTSSETYFFPAGDKQNYIDGGNFANNPIAILAAGMHAYKPSGIIKILHLDTGMTLNKTGDGGNKNLLQWGVYVMDNLVARSNQSSTYIAQQWLGEKNVFNASPSVTHGYAMDKVKYIDEIINIWDEYYKSVKPELLKFINTI